ncbi:MAG: hypothetical protein HPY66_0239 [Firmicutes bacterium]|nr:hypothetical protein [Bacillota bacterium]
MLTHACFPDSGEQVFFIEFIKGDYFVEVFPFISEASGYLYIIIE